MFIRAKNDHTRFDVCPGFWDWLVQANQAGKVFSIDKVREELMARTDDLAAWAAARPASFFLPADAAVVAALPTVSAWVMGQGYTPAAINEFFANADYYLVAHALARSWKVVTHEVPAPGAKKRVKLPDVCAGVGVQCTSPFQMLNDEGARFVL